MAGGLIAVSILAAAGFLYSSMDLKKDRKQDVAQASTGLDLLRQRTGMSIPGEARLTYFDHQPSRDELLRAKLSVTRSGFQKFLSDNGFVEGSFSEVNRGFLGTDEGDWDPQRQTGLVVLAPPREDSTNLYVGALKRQSEIQLYILWFGT